MRSLGSLLFPPFDSTRMQPQAVAFFSRSILGSLTPAFPLRSLANCRSPGLLSLWLGDLASVTFRPPTWKRRICHTWYETIGLVCEGNVIRKCHIGSSWEGQDSHQTTDVTTQPVIAFIFGFWAYSHISNIDETFSQFPWTRVVEIPNPQPSYMIFMWCYSKGISTHLLDVPNFHCAFNSTTCYTNLPHWARNHGANEHAVAEPGLSSWRRGTLS